MSVQTAIGNSAPYAVVSATQNVDKSWTALLTVAQSTTTSIQLVPASGSEPKPYDWIDTGRFFTPPSGAATFYTTEGVFGIATSGKTPFAEPPSRAALMQSAFGAAIVNSGVFASREMPHGATISDGSVYFVLHAPHAIVAALVLVKEGCQAQRRAN